MSASTLVMLTDRYPFGVGELPFVEPELRALLDHFDVVVVPANTRGEINPACDRTILSRIRVATGHAAWKRSEQIRYGCKAALSPLLRRDLSGCSAPQIREAWGYLARALYMQEVVSSLGLFGHPDNTAFYSFWLNSSALGLALQKEIDPRIKILTRTNGYDLYNFRAASGRQPFRQYLRESVDKVLFSSQVGLDYFRDTFGPETSKGQYRLARLGCHDHVAPPRTSEQKFTVMSCSNVIPLKRVYLLAEAISLIDDRSIRWVHAGDGPELDVIRAFAEKESLDASFLGQVTNTELMDYYRLNPVDLFATMSSSEGGCPVSVTEALSFSIPILASSAGGGVVEQVNDSNGILLGENPDPCEIAAALTLFMEMGEGGRTSMGRASHEMWAMRFDVRKTTSHVVEIAQSLLS